MYGKTLEEMLSDIDEMLMYQGNFLARQPESEERDKAIEENKKAQLAQLGMYHKFEDLKTSVRQVHFALRMTVELTKIYEELNED